MSLRSKLFLFFGVLMALLLVAQLWMVALLTREANQEFGDAALSVSRELTQLLRDQFGKHEPCLPAEGSVTRRYRVGDQEAVSAEVRLLKERVIHAPTGPVGSLGAGPEGSSPAAQKTGIPSIDPEKAGRFSTEVLLVKSPSGEQMQLRVRTSDLERHIELPTGLERSTGDLSRRLLFGTLGILVIGLTFGALISHGVSRPLNQLSHAAQGLSEGQFGVQVADQAGGEVGQAIAAFNRMSSRLQEYDRQQRRWEENRHLTELGEIARGLAHTIRNPLNTLGLTLEEMAAKGDGAQEAAVGSLAESARRQISRIDNWIRSFLTLANQPSDLRQTIDLRMLLEDVALEASQHVAASVRFDEAAMDRLPRICGVPAEVRGVLQALVINAVEAAGEKGTVEVAAGLCGDGRIRLEVSDDGPGIPDEVRKRLFSPHISTKSRGSGMGIYLAHRIATSRYDGSLLFEANSPRGTRALLTLATTRTAFGGGE